MNLILEFSNPTSLHMLCCFLFWNQLLWKSSFHVTAQFQLQQRIVNITLYHTIIQMSIQKHQCLDTITSCLLNLMHLRGLTVSHRRGNQDLLWCIQSNKGNCLWEWTIAVSRFSPVPLKNNDRVTMMSERRGEICSQGSKVEGILVYSFYTLTSNYVDTFSTTFLTTTTLTVHTSWENKQRGNRREEADTKGTRGFRGRQGTKKRKREKRGGRNRRRGGREIILVIHRSQAPPCKRQQSDF